MPTNLFGPVDNYNLQSSYVRAALLCTFYDAKRRGGSQVEVWGAGASRREFLHSDDMAEGALFLMTLPDRQFDALAAAELHPLVNLGSGKDITIRELAELIADAAGFGVSWYSTAANPTARSAGCST